MAELAEWTRCADHLFSILQFSETSIMAISQQACHQATSEILKF
jgi:hypothetical protein